MKHAFSICLILALFANVMAISNWNGWLDTTITWSKDTTTKKYSKVYDLTSCIATGVVMMVNDTAASGFANDSTRLVYGFQVGEPVINASGVLDTAWGAFDTLDTISVLSYGLMPAGGRYSMSTDLLSEDWGKADTSQVTGYAVQSRPIRPYNWNVFVRIWWNGLTGLRAGSSNKVVIGVKRMLGLPTAR